MIRRMSNTDRERVNAFARQFLRMPDHQSMLLLITVGGAQTSTSVETDEAGTITVEIPEVILAAIEAWTSGLNVVIVSRSFDLGTVARHTKSGYPIPYKTVRSWVLRDYTELNPMTALQVRAAYAYDSVTGTLWAVDTSEIFADAWELPRNTDSI
jgi:hypothetical protein